MTANTNLVSLTADIVAAHVSNNYVAVGDVAGMIATVYGALQKASAPEPPAPPEKPKGAVSVRASIKPDYLVSMIDGKPYRMLKRHLVQNGYTPESYRQAFGLPIDYPMVAPTYAEQRRQLAHKIGLGRRPKSEGASGKTPRKPRTPKS